MTVHSTISRYRARRALPARAGIGLKAEHYGDILAAPAGRRFLRDPCRKLHGGRRPPHHQLEAIRRTYPLSLHGVGLSIGGAAPLDRAHLARLKALIDRYEPGLFSEHLAWSSHGGAFLNDLLPLPYNGATLRRVCDHIDEVQDAPRHALAAGESLDLRDVRDQHACARSQFLREVVKRTGCGLLLDVSNVYVSATNHGFDPYAYIDAFPFEQVGEIHLAGFAEHRDERGAAAHRRAPDARLSEAVWRLYEHARAGSGPSRP